MPFFLKNCLKLRKKKNRKKPKIKDVVKPARDRTDIVTNDEIWPDCRPSVSTISEQGNEELDARACNEIKTNVSTGKNSTPAVESAKAITKVSVAIIQEGEEIVEMDKKCKDGAFQIENIECADIKSDESVEMLNKEQHDDPKSEEEVAFKTESISENSDRRGLIFSLYSEPSEVSSDSSVEITVEITSEIQVAIDPQQKNGPGNYSILEGKEKDAENNWMEPPQEPQHKLLADASEEKVCRNDDVGFTEKNSESRDIEENESSQIAMKEMSKIIAAVTVRSNVFETIEELQRLQCIINENRQKQMEVCQNTEQIKDAEISGVVNKETLSVVTDTDCKENENLLRASEHEDVKIYFNDDNNWGCESIEFHHERKLLTCANPSTSHVTNFDESNASFSGDYLLKKQTEKETEPTVCENTAGRTTNYEFITPENNIVGNVSDKNECSKSDKSSSNLSILGVGESMDSNTAEISKDTEETSKLFSRPSCTGDMNYEIPLEHKHDLSNLNSKMHSGENFSKTDIDRTNDSFIKESHNVEKKILKSLSFENTENNFKKLSTESGTGDLREKYRISVCDFQTKKSINKSGVYESTFNGETNMNDSKDDISEEIKRRNVKNKIDGDFLVFTSNMSNNKSKDSLSRNLDCNKEDHGSGDYRNYEVMSKTKKNESDLQNRNENYSKNTKTDAIDMSVLNNIEEPHRYSNIEIASELEKKDSNSHHLEEISYQIVEKNIVNDVENISDESKVLSSSDKYSKFSTVIDQTVEKDEIRDSKHREDTVSIEERSDISDSRNNLRCNDFKEDGVSFTQNCNKSGLKYSFEKKVFDMNTNSNSRSNTAFDSQNGKNPQYFNILQQFSLDTSNSFVIQAGLNVKQHSSANLLSKSSINNFATNDNKEDLTDIDYRADFFQYNEKSRLIETSSPENSAEDLKNICFPMNINRSEKMMEKKAAKENILNGQNQNQEKINDIEEFKYPILEMFRENINIPLKDSLLDENINSKNKNSVFRETCFDSNAALDIKTSKKCSSDSLTFESNSTSSLLESGDENTEENWSENIAMFANGDVCNKEGTMQKSGPYNGAYLANEKKVKSGPALANAHHSVQTKPLITINILPRISCKPRKIFSTRREDGGNGAKSIPRYKKRHDPDISLNFTRGIPENVLGEIEIRRRESLDAFNKKKKEALSDMKPTARVIPIMQFRSSGVKSQSKRPPAAKTSPRLHRSIEQSLEGPTSPFGHPEKSKIANGDGNMRQPLDAAELNKNTRKHSNESLHEISSQASEKMTPVRKRVLDVSREIRSRKYPVRIDGKTYVINARNRKNPYNLKPPEVELVQPKEKKIRLKEKQSIKHSPDKREFKIHSPEKIECLPSAKVEPQNKPERLKLSQDLLKMFDNAFGRYAGRGRLDSNSISYKRSREWLRDAGIVGKILTDDEVNDAFKCTSGVKLTMNKGDYRNYIKKLARLKRLNYDELYEKLCSVVAKQSYAAREIM